MAHEAPANSRHSGFQPRQPIMPMDTVMAQKIMDETNAKIKVRSHPQARSAAALYHSRWISDFVRYGCNLATCDSVMYMIRARGEFAIHTIFLKELLNFTIMAF